MKAWVCHGYGGPNVLELEERPLPVPGDNEILVQVRATTVTSGDVRVRTLHLPRGFGLIGRLAIGLTGPRQPILGTELAGTVKAVGKKVTTFKTGDAVIGFPGAAMGGHAQYQVLSIHRPVILKPPHLSFEEAVSLPFGGMTALHFLRKAQLKVGDQVLVIGASGAVGSAMVQLATHMGAIVTAVTSGGNAGLVRSLGASAVIDYTVQDFTKAPESYDIIADTVGARSFSACCPVLKEHGRYLSVAGGLSDLLARPRGSKKSMGGPAPEKPDDLRELIRLAAMGVLKPVIDRTYTFAQLPQAHAYVETGRKRGSVVVTVQQD
ncbi:MAG: Zn-dependent oxidoreductase [Burkholderiales bacterium RIFCSPLOWO2_12_FULL_61_40]|nr:MAG: Zn-dependent oxidoreductase [Burkholderiales bacterium RIFCSPLOWO2_12_FULL_61_40]